MKSLHTTNAQLRSIFLIALLVLVIGLVGLFSFNLPKNEYIAEANVLPNNPAFVDDFPTLDYSNVPQMSMSHGVMIDNTNDRIVYVDDIYRLESDAYVVYNKNADPYNLLTSSVYSIRGNILGTKKIAFDNKGERYKIFNGKAIINMWIACSQVGTYFPYIHIYWYNSSGAKIGESLNNSLSFMVYNNTFEPIYVSFDAPVGAVSYIIDLELHFNHKNTQFYLLPGYTYTSGGSTPRISMEEVKYLSNLYGTGPYWNKRYLSSQESLELARESLRQAQEDGATFTGALDSIITAPINAIAEFMTFEIPFFNVNLGTILAVIISILLVAFVIKILVSRG